MLRGFSLITGSAFVVLIALIAGLAVNGILQLQKLDEQMNIIVEQHNRKIDLVTQTQLAAHMRTDSLFRMALADDPFERDQHFMNFNRAGFLVGSGRSALRKLGFTPDERQSFDRQQPLIGSILAVQEQVTDLLAAERFEQARRLLEREAIPLQQAFNQQLSEMRNLYQLRSLEAQRQARMTYQQTFLGTLAFGVLAITLSMLIAWRTLRHISRKSAAIQREMHEIETSRARLREEATHDALTGLANRRLFYDRLEQAIHHAKRYGGKIGLLFVDMDQFKEINDRHGHHVGDAVLVEVAKRLVDCVRESDSVARLGGDEFVVLLDGIQGREDCRAAANKIEQSLDSGTLPFADRLVISASIGQALFPEDGEDEEALIRVADASMYRIKSGSGSERQTAFAFAS
jgi:diguanylate cyclase (GGDEF)-like protein